MYICICICIYVYPVTINTRTRYDLPFHRLPLNDICSTAELRASIEWSWIVLFTSFVVLRCLSFVPVSYAAHDLYTPFSDKGPIIINSPGHYSFRTYGTNLRRLIEREARFCDSPRKRLEKRKSVSLSRARSGSDDTTRTHTRSIRGKHWKRNGGGQMSAYEVQGERGLQSHGNKRKLSRRKIVVIYSCVRHGSIYARS